jgi:coenzyme F420-reducing hydrogenase gamma subunit
MKEGKLCLGPISCGGCDAICTTAGFVCLGCRGPVEQTNLYKIKELARNSFSDKELNQRLEIYGEFVETMAKNNHEK